MTRSLAAVCLAVAAWVATTSPARAAFHLWEIVEVYSNADGTVQYIELFTTASGERFIGNHTIQSTATGRTFSFPDHLPPGSTANRSFLIATPGFANLPGGVTPDYTLPTAPWFSAGGDTLNFASVDTFTFAAGQLPLDGVNSLIDLNPTGAPSLSVAANTPRNFSGATGSLIPSLAGDLDGDRLVGRSDAAMLGANFGRASDVTAAMGDFSGDAIVGLADLAFLQARFLSPGSPALSSAAGSAAVPEPSVLVLVGGAGLVGLVRFRTNRAKVR